MKMKRKMFGALGLSDQYKGADLAAGAGVGLLGVAGGQYLQKQAFALGLPDFLKKSFPLLGALVLGGAAYMVQKKGNRSRAKAHFLGAGLAGATVTVWQMLKDNVGALSGVYFPAQGAYGSVYATDRSPSYNGIYMMDASGKPRTLGDLATGTTNDLALMAAAGPVDPTMALVNPGMYS